MIRYRLLLLLIVACSYFANGQNLKKVHKAVEKAEFDKMKESLDKFLEKNPNSFGGIYFKSVYFLDSTQNQLNLDSARIYILQTEQLKDVSNQEDLDDWAKLELPDEVIGYTKNRIIELAFDDAVTEPTLGSTNKFIADWPETARTPRVVFVRDSIAYADALGVNTWESFKDFVDTYPESAFYEKAHANYEQLLYNHSTEGGTLESFESFIKKHPDNSHYADAINSIFLLSTKDHRATSYEYFLDKYGQTQLGKKAGDFYYYLSKYDTSIDLTSVLNLHPLADSLQVVYKLEKTPLAPFVENGKFYFLNADGITLDGIQSDENTKNYNCGNIASEWIKVKADGAWKMMNRQGLVMASDIKEIIKEEDELILIRDAQNKKTLYHKSSSQALINEVDDFKILNRQSIAILKEKRWGIYTFSGQQVLKPTYDDISSHGLFVVLEHDSKYAVTQNNALLSPDFSPQQITFPYNDYEVLSDSIFLGFDDDNEALVNHELKTLLPLGDQRIYVSQPIWYIKDANDTYKVFDRIEEKLIEPGFSNLAVNNQWMVMKRDSKWMIRGIKDSVESLTIPLDSAVLLHESAAYIERRDSAFLFFANGTEINFPSKAKVKLMNQQSGGVVKYLLMTIGSKQTIINQNGESVFNGSFEDVQYLTDSLFIVQSRGKYGIYELGKGFAVKAIYDLIDKQGDMAYLLKSKSIGCFDINNKTTIPAIYPSKVERYAPDLYLVSKNNKFGLVNSSNKNVVDISYQEIKYWNDSTYWGRKDSTWQLVAVKGDIIIDNAKYVQSFIENSSDKVFKYQQEGKYGLISQQRGVIIPTKYDDIVNLGSVESPIYFAEQHLETAELYVVTYFDRLGNNIKSQAYSPQDYDHIYCLK